MSFDAFMAERDILIDQLEEKVITKTTFIEDNFEQFVDGVKPPTTEIKTVEEGIIAYHYYNTKAKILMMQGNDCYFRDAYQAKHLHGLAHDQYLKKDTVTMALVEVLHYENMEAYFVTLESEELNEELFEIVLTNYRRIIFHSKDKRLLNRLRKNGVFSEVLQASKIDHYVNSKYCE